MKEFTRIAWASAEARSIWEPRIRAISNAWLDVELTSLGKLRSAALVFDGDRVRRSKLPAIQVAPNRYAVGENAAALAEAYLRHDDKVIGILLGFPSCCRAFFDRVWNAEHKRDTTLSMTGDVHSGAANILGRWLGVRLVPHLPCSWDCKASAQAAREYSALLDPDHLRWTQEILSWSVEYSALHGIAIITFPVVKVVTSTDYTAKTQRIVRFGTTPPEAPRGIKFPFSTPFIPLTSLKSFTQSIEVIK